MDNLRDQIRSAIERGEFDHAGELCALWSAEIVESVRLGASDAGSWAQFRDLYAWARGVLLAERAQISARLRPLHAAGVYAAQPDTSGTSLVQGRF
jgi:hypothetical protein